MVLARQVKCLMGDLLQPMPEKYIGPSISSKMSRRTSIT